MQDFSGLGRVGWVRAGRRETVREPGSSIVRLQTSSKDALVDEELSGLSNGTTFGGHQGVERAKWLDHKVKARLSFKPSDRFL